MPVTSTLLDQAHNAIERKLFAMKGFHHPAGSQQAFLTGLAQLYNLVPYQRRAKHASQCGVEVEGGRLPSRRSEEHTSELQSLRHLVCRLLLEKKKNTQMK